MIARFLGVRVWDLPRVPFHWQEEAEIILVAQYQAKQELSKNIAEATKLMIPEIVIPEF